ncbi:CBS domain-containing protein [Paenibacillus sp. GD4]|jgi:CBS domain-containing protein|uniref:CBS domain-containing protein n=1 Tax=Paenibacillus sp. GD4 TaxID=3068890 RepID=UPI002796DBD6|nr:CBS domain-containing protein [Paenibacillus sp. GD4]MDQ1910800.1 CBS domain-containing protein [Paenibacillus sp. GD4]
MQAHEIMISPVYKVKVDDTVRSVVEKFIKYRISGMPVVNDRNEIVAYISDGDIMRYIGKHEDQVVDFFFYMGVIHGDDEQYEERAKRILNVNVLAIAQKKVYTVAWDEDIENIAALLGKKRIKKLPVERRGVLVGIISRGDVIRHSFKSLL